MESSAGADPLLAFAAEGVPTPNTPGAAIGSQRSTRRKIIAPVAILVLVGIACIGGVAFWRLCVAYRFLKCRVF